MAAKSKKEPTPKTPPIEPDSPAKPRGAIVRFTDTETEARLCEHEARLCERHVALAMSIDRRATLRDLVLQGLDLAELLVGLDCTFGELVASLRGDA